MSPTATTERMRTMAERRPLLALLAAAVALALSACASAGPVVQMQADYPSYDTPESLLAEATIIVEGTVIGTETTVLLPRFEGDTAEENPYQGVPADEQQKAIEKDGGVPGTVVSLRVDAVHLGEVSVGDEVTFIQTGGVIDGVRYEVAGEANLTTNSHYLLFGADSVDGAFAVLGGAAGAYGVDGDAFVAQSPEAAPVEKLTRSELQELMGG